MPPPDPAWLKGWNDAIRAIAEAGIRPNAPTQSPAEAYSTAVAVEQMAYQGERLALYGNLGRDLVSAREQLAACNTSHATVAARAVRHKAALEKAKAQVARVKAVANQLERLRDAATQVGDTAAEADAYGNATRLIRQALEGK